MGDEFIFDTEKFQSTIDNTIKNSEYISELVDSLVEKCCKELDAYVGYVKTLLDDTNNPITNDELDDFIMTLPTLLYFVNVNQETMGIREDTAKMTEQDKYNRVIIETAGTIQNKQSMAKLATQNEALAVAVYQRAAKKIRWRTEAAYEILQSAKKVLSRRVLELEISKNSPNT